MEFCEICHNMYYMKLEEETKRLVYVCKHCNHVDKQSIETSNLKVYKYSKQTKKQEQEIKSIIVFSLQEKTMKI